MITVTRVYNNGEQKVFQYESSQMVMDGLPYSMEFRPGCAYFVGDVCVQTGYLTPERIREIPTTWEPQSNGRA